MSLGRIRRSILVATAAVAALALAVVPAAAASAVPLPTGVLTGVVRDAIGATVPDALVRLSSGSHQFEATSGASGDYEIPGVPAGEYVGELIPPAGSPSYVLGDFEVVVGVGAPTSFDPVLAFETVINGVVTDPSNATVAGVIVAVHDITGGNRVSNAPAGTPADGTFARTVGPGEWFMSFAPPQGSNLQYQWYSGADTVASSQDFDAQPTGAGSPFDASVQLAASTTQVTGVVTRGGVGQVDAWVELRNSAGDLVDYLDAGPGGAFSSAGMPTGTFTLQAFWSEGPTSTRARSSRSTSRPPTWPFPTSCWRPTRASSQPASPTPTRWARTRCSRSTLRRA